MGVKLHVGGDGLPRNCVAQEGNCPLAPNMGHFAKPEQAQAFADRLNELKAEGYSYHGMVGDDVKKMDNAELIYVQKDILNKAKENDNYSDYKSQIKWQKEVRSKAQKEMKAIVDEDNKTLANLAKKIDKVADARKAWKTEKDPDARSSKYREYQAALIDMNETYHKAALVTQSNQSKFGQLVDKKDTATAKFIPLMEKRATHAGIKQLKANVDAEITEREGGAQSSGKEIQPDKVAKPKAPSGPVYRPDSMSDRLQGYVIDNYNRDAENVNVSYDKYDDTYTVTYTEDGETGTVEFYYDPDTDDYITENDGDRFGGSLKNYGSREDRREIERKLQQGGVSVGGITYDPDTNTYSAKWKDSGDSDFASTDFYMENGKMFTENPRFEEED